MPTYPQDGLYTVGGAPAIPISEADVPAFAAEMQAWIVKNFSQLYAAIYNKSRQPLAMDICRKLGMLAPDDCLITDEDIDQTTFTYATAADQILVPGSGVLPFVQEDPQYYAAGSQIQSTASNVPTMVRPPIPDEVHLNFGVYLTTGNNVNAMISAPNEERKNLGDDDQIGIQSSPIDENNSIWVYWLVLPFI